MSGPHTGKLASESVSRALGCRGLDVLFPVGKPRRILSSRLTKWSLTAACILTALAWLPSRWVCPWVSITNGRTNYSFGIGYCSVLVQQHHDTDKATEGWRIEVDVWSSSWESLWFWVPAITSLGGTETSPGFSMRTLVLPLYIPLLILSIPTAYLWLPRLRAIRSNRRRRRNVCPRCAYSQLSLPPNSRCPECGHTQGS